MATSALVSDRPFPPFTPGGPPPRASRYITFKGKEIPRTVGFLQEKKITCPGGHIVNRRSRVLEDELLFCDYLDGPRAHGAQSCSTISGFGIYALEFPARGGRKRTFLADCSLAELAEIERYGLDPDGILDYFGMIFTR